MESVSNAGDGWTSMTCFVHHIAGELASNMFQTLLFEKALHPCTAPNDPHHSTLVHPSCSLDAAASPASVLQSLCEKVGFDGAAAMETHRALYRQKLVGIVDQSKGISEAQAEDLKRARRILCITPDIAKKVG